MKLLNSLVISSKHGSLAKSSSWNLQCIHLFNYNCNSQIDWQWASKPLMSLPQLASRCSEKLVVASPLCLPLSSLQRIWLFSSIWGHPCLQSAEMHSTLEAIAYTSLILSSISPSFPSFKDRDHRKGYYRHRDLLQEPRPTWVEEVFFNLKGYKVYCHYLGIICGCQDRSIQSSWFVLKKSFGFSLN